MRVKSWRGPWLTPKGSWSILKPWIGPLWPVESRFCWPVAFTDGSCATQLEAMRTWQHDVVPDLYRTAGKCFEFSGVSMKALEYERHVAAGGIPTRDEFHDWFNGLVWLAYPRAKAEINRLHVSDNFSSNSTSGNQRSPLRDAITLWDENGAVLLTSNHSVTAALKNHDWQYLFVQLRAEWGVSIHPYCFGHGLLDALRNPHKGLCAKVKVVQVEDSAIHAMTTAAKSAHSTRHALDEMSLSIIQGLKSPRDFSPLPVMGIPGWFEENMALGFYDDASVFRKKPTGRDSK